MKSVRIWSFSGQYFPSYGLNAERCRVSFRIQSEWEKIRIRKTPNTDTFHVMINIRNSSEMGSVSYKGNVSKCVYMMAALAFNDLILRR